jgi:anaphase-promoting complex subunit 6
VHYRQQRYTLAVECFLEALKLCKHRPERLRFAWEPAMFNLGHSYRKLGQYDYAIRYYENALSYNPKEASTHSALGLTYHLQGKLEQAIGHYHNALGLKPEDTFSSEMLDKALEESFAGPFDMGIPSMT